MKLIDLPTVISPGMPKPRSAPPVLLRYILEPSEEQEEAQGFTNKMEEYTVTTHIVTHIDTLAHFSVHGKNIDEYDVSEFFLVPTQMLNIRRGKFEAITTDDLRIAEERDGAIQDGDPVLINTGCHQYYYNEAYNCAPYLAKEAAEYLAEKQIKIIGTDFFTVDDPREKDESAHVVLLNQRGTLIIGCVMNLDAIPCTHFQTVCLPLKIRQGPGAFARMIAVCGQPVDGTGRREHRMNEAYMEKLLSLNGKTAVVAGSSSGIGQTIAEALANFGAYAAVMDRSQQGTKETCTRVRSSGGSCQGYAIDITDEEAQNRFFDGFLAEHKHLDTFVANVRINVRGEPPEVTVKRMELLLGTDFIGIVHGLDRVAGAMKKQHSGNMVIITSVSALSPLANQALYSAIKSAMESVMRSLAVTMAEYGVRVNSCVPGCIHNALNQHIFSREQFRREKERGIPLGRVGNPEDIGGVVACMVNDAYRFVTDSTILVDGGELLRPKMKQPVVDCAEI